jgi:hypothetical protein
MTEAKNGALRHKKATARRTTGAKSPRVGREGAATQSHRFYEEGSVPYERNTPLWKKWYGREMSEAGAGIPQGEYLHRAYYLEARLGFPSDRALADAVGVHRSQVSRWSQGKLAQRENAWLLRDLGTAVSRLADYLERSTIYKWLFSANPDLDGEQPMELLRQGRLPEVLMAIEAQTSGAFA